MEIYIHAIEVRTDAQAILKQLDAAKKCGVGRVGVFVKSIIGYDSMSCDIEDAAKIIEKHMNSLP